MEDYLNISILYMIVSIDPDLVSIIIKIDNLLQTNEQGY